MCQPTAALRGVDDGLSVGDKSGQRGSATSPPRVTQAEHGAHAAPVALQHRSPREAGAGALAGMPRRQAGPQVDGAASEARLRPRPR